MNNNADLDNGVYHKFAEEEENKDKNQAPKNTELSSVDSLQSSFNKESSLKSDSDEERKVIIEKKKKSKKLKP